MCIEHCRGISRAGLTKRKERGTFLRTACHLRWPLTLCTYTKHNTNTNANTNTNTYIKNTRERRVTFLRAAGHLRWPLSLRK